MESNLLAPLGKENGPSGVVRAAEVDEGRSDKMVLTEPTESAASGLTEPHTGSMICKLPDHRIAAGCTACVALKHGSDLFVANAGEPSDQ